MEALERVALENALKEYDNVTEDYEDEEAIFNACFAGVEEPEELEVQDVSLQVVEVEVWYMIPIPNQR